MKKFFIKSFGCQYNEWDAARLAFVLGKYGLAEAAKDNADVIFLLNCSVRKTGVDRAMSFTKTFIENEKKVIITGCVLAEDKEKFTKKGATVWNGEDFAELREILGVKNDVNLDDGHPKTNLVPITKGCNNFCSYCAVPYTRGREISRPVANILADVSKIVESGEKEIWLLGQNVNSYEFGFADLLYRINEIQGDFTVYFTSNHPKDMTDEIIEAIATLPKIAKYIHLPLQSGSNKILKAMNRPYTKEKYLELVDKIKKRIPEIKISTDTIVGFPGETEDDLQETAEILRKVQFSQTFNNKYSPREGTLAYKLGDPIPWSEKERRWRVLDKISFKKK
ncbi:MAG: MiaB/RimO family radical SAM methylthiotransferase [Candidatus Berkelbacteria bacterium]